MKENKEEKKKIDKNFIVSEELKELASRVIQQERIDVGNARIEYLLVYPYISKTTAGRCIRTGRELKFFSGFDYLVEMSGDLWDAINDETRYALMHHELLHVLVVTNEKTGNLEYKIKNHDINDFAHVIEKYGVNWANKISVTIASLYDLNPKEQDNITI